MWDGTASFASMLWRMRGPLDRGMFVAGTAVTGTTALGTTEASTDYVVLLGFSQFNGPINRPGDPGRLLCIVSHGALLSVSATVPPTIALNSFSKTCANPQ